MPETALTLLLLNLAFIGLLPRIFFQRGRFNLMWWVTAGPFFCCAAFLVLSYLGRLPAWTGSGGAMTAARQSLAVALSAASIALIAFTLGSHQRPLKLWHQNGDRPEHLVSHGPYRRVRHPFYAAFLVALFAAVLLSPQAGTLATLAWGLTQLTLTAAKEERTFKASSLGDQYSKYMQQTGRFLPRLRRVSA